MNKRALTDINSEPILTSGEESFSIESRILREFGERLVKHPEVALLELVKNAYDADAKACTVDHRFPDDITVTDTGHGMTLEEFQRGWMRIGTSSKVKKATSREFERPIVGEKGIGRFAVRYLGRHLVLESVAYDQKRGCHTRLKAQFNWPLFDKNEDLGTVKVPYNLYRVKEGEPIGTKLIVTQLRPNTQHINFREVLTGSLGLLSPYQALLRKHEDEEQQDLPDLPESDERDPGFNLIINSPDFSGESSVAGVVLRNFVLRCVVAVDGSRLKLRLYRRGERKPAIRINDRFESGVDRMYADLRFFPSRKGTFTGMPLDGREARTWIKDHAGVAVFDRNFRVLPYGTEGDDWLSLSADTARNERNPRSSLAKRHFPMDEETRRSTQLNYMLRLPYPSQLVGAVQVYGVRSEEQEGDEGLFATADRQGFVDNETFHSLVDIVRGAVEVIAYADRELQLEVEAAEVEEAAKSAEEETREAIGQIRKNPNLSASEKTALVKHLVSAQKAASRQGDLTKNREAALEVMSLLGVVAGFMTHEFHTAITHLERSHAILRRLSKGNSALAEEAGVIAKQIRILNDFVAYSKGYVTGASIVPEKLIPAKPRIQSVVRVFGKYASGRHIEVAVDVSTDVRMPRVPISLYGGMVLNLYTNALKAITSKPGKGPREIAIRAWNQKKVHRLQVSDTGVGIPREPLKNSAKYDYIESAQIDNDRTWIS